MKTPALILGVGLLAAAAALPASAKEDKKKGTPLRYAHAYATAMEEAKDRGCVVFANFHIDH
jgi:hypothetical protein